MDQMTEIFACMADDKFKEIMQNDEVLNELEEEKNNPQREYFELCCVLFKRFKIAGLTCIPITPAMWCLLYCLGNKIIVGGKVEKEDIDVFIYLMHNGLDAVDENLFNNAELFCDKHEIDYQYALLEICDMIKLTFRPMEMFPLPSIKDEDVRFNVDWLTKVVSMACRVCNKTSDEVMMNMSLCECLYYVVQYCRVNDKDNTIRRRNSDEVNEQIYKRTMQLGKKYWEENYKGK